MKGNRFMWGVMIFACLLDPALVLAGESEITADVTTRVEVERQSIQTKRAVFEANYLQVQASCYARFAVSDCLNDAKAKRRVAMDELRRQEVILNDLDRSHKATEALDRIQKNVSSARQQENVQQRVQALQAHQEKQKRADEKRAVESSPKANVQSRHQTSDAAISPVDSLAQQQRYLEKIQEAKQHKIDKEKNLAEHEGAIAKPLPLPPGF